MWALPTVNMEGRQHIAAAAQFYWADERMSKQVCLVQTPTLPGLLSKEIKKYIVTSFSVCISLRCSQHHFSISPVMRLCKGFGKGLHIGHQYKANKTCVITLQEQ